MSRLYPDLLLATQSFSEDDPAKLKLTEGDKIIVIDGKPDHYYWKGQNERTFDIGLFPRCVTSPLRRKLPDDISKPLRNSFIHTGHGSIDEKSWGSPSFIDEVYLKNPMEPPDVLGIIEEDVPAPRLPDRSKSKAIQDI